MNTIDRDGPPDGDYASYVERLTGAAGRTPGRVESRGALAKRDARAAASRSTGEPAAQAGGTLAEAAAEALRRAADGARGQGGAANRGAGAKGASGAASADALHAAGRAVGLRLSRWLMIGGFALIALAILDLVPAMTPLPGFALLLLSIVLRNLSNR